MSRREARHPRPGSRQEQDAWDQYNLKAALERRLQEFIALAQRGFHRADATAGKLLIFLNPEHTTILRVTGSVY